MSQTDQSWMDEPINVTPIDGASEKQVAFLQDLCQGLGLDEMEAMVEVDETIGGNHTGFEGLTRDEAKWLIGELKGRRGFREW